MHRLIDARISEAAGDAERGGGSKTSMHAEAAFAPPPKRSRLDLIWFCYLVHLGSRAGLRYFCDHSAIQRHSAARSGALLIGASHPARDFGSWCVAWRSMVGPGRHNTWIAGAGEFACRWRAWRRRLSMAAPIFLPSHECVSNAKTGFSPALSEE
ncbi:hypothetical protein HKX42_08110 [Salinisphaera sp. USBA-960]|nr:hypothetical protein [Salifodinibacter halophilus]